MGYSTFVAKNVLDTRSTILRSKNIIHPARSPLVVLQIYGMAQKYQNVNEELLKAPGRSQLYFFYALPLMAVWITGNRVPPGGLH